MMNIHDTSFYHTPSQTESLARRTSSTERVAGDVGMGGNDWVYGGGGFDFVSQGNSRDAVVDDASGREFS